MIPIQTVIGVDFSGAKLAGQFIWLARMQLRRGRPKLLTLLRLDQLCGTAERDVALLHLVTLIKESDRTLWAMDFPFGLPIEVPGGAWPRQMVFLTGFGDDAYTMGLECVRIARGKGLPPHPRRATDVENKTPFDCYHYRIIYQTFFGMRDVLRPLRREPATAILPYQYGKLPAARRILVEACPASTLKRLGLPHHNYKQPIGGPLTPLRRRTRSTIVERMAAVIEMNDGHRRAIMRNPGGDALDAVIAAVGGWQSFAACDHAAVAGHPRYPKEGRLFV